MTRARFLLIGLIALLTVPASSLLWAHGGHVHRIMGTVLAVDDARVEVKDKDEKVHSIRLDAKTKILRGKTAVPRTEITVGERVVVSVGTGAPPLTASEVRLGASAAQKR